MNCIAFSPNGKYLVSGSKDSAILLWDIETNSAIKNFKGHTKSVNSLAFSPQGNFLVSGSEDSTI